MIGGLVFALVALLFLLSLLSPTVALGALAAMALVFLVSLVRWEVGSLPTSPSVGPARVRTPMRPTGGHAS